MGKAMGSAKLSRAEKIRTEAHDWVITLEESPSSETDRKRFERWLDADPRHVESYDRAITVRSAIASLRIDDIDGDLRQSYQDFRSDRRSNRPRWILKKPTWTVGLAGAIAATVALAVVLLRAPVTVHEAADPSEEMAYETAAGERVEITLPDGTIALLDGRTALAVIYSERKRRVLVQTGAAFFDVAPDTKRPFSVESEELSAVALGTRFDVRTSERGYRVSVEEGQVEVSYPVTIGSRVTRTIATRSLLPGQTVAATLRDGIGEVKQVDLSNIAAWRKDRLVFQDATVAEFVADLNRRSPTPIRLDPADTFSEFKIDGAFVGNDVDRLLLALTEMHPVEVDRSDSDTVLIRRRR